MTSSTLGRRLRTMLFVGLLASMLGACAGAASSAPASQPPASTAPSAAAPSDPAAAIDVDTLVRDASANDAKTVRVTGNFLADAGSAQLCQLLMESYPPQCGGGIQLTGTVPADTLARLTTTSEPDLKKMWWGFVTVTGTFHATGANGQPSIELSEIVLADT